MIPSSDLHFHITEITRIIHRHKVRNWHVEQINYPNAYVLAMMLEGEITYTIDHSLHTVGTGDVFLFPPGLPRSGAAAPDTPCSFVSIVFHAEFSDAFHGHLDKPLILWDTMADSMRRHFTDVANAWLGKDAMYRVRCNYLTTEILYRLFLSKMPYHQVPHIKRLEKARAFIREHFREQLSVEQLARSADLSPSYFRKLFHQAYGCSPMQYITELRMENAKDLLLSGEVTVAEAANLSGFDDIYYFSTLFKRKTGMSPRNASKKANIMQP